MIQIINNSLIELFGTCKFSLIFDTHEIFSITYGEIIVYVGIFLLCLYIATILYKCIKYFVG